MPTAYLSQTIDQPVEEVFAAVIDVENFPAWNPTTVSATRITEGEVGDGIRFRMAVRGMGQQELELQDYEEGSSVTLVPLSRLISGGHRFVFTDEGTQTRVDHELVMEPKGVLRLVSPLMGVMARKNLRDTAAALQSHLESAG